MPTVGVLGLRARTVEPPAGVVAALRRIHPLLGLRYLPFHHEWAIVWYWDENDPRRRHLASGTLAPRDAHTIVCILPKDCPPEQAAGYAMRHLILNPPAEMWRQAALRVERHNESVEQAVMDAALADIHNRIEVSHWSLKAHFAEGADGEMALGERQELTRAEREALTHGEPIV